MYTMNRFLMLRFEFYKSFYYSLILCIIKSDGTEYRLTVMHGDLEKQLCNNNTIREVNGCLQVELSSNKLQSQIKTEIAKVLGKVIGKPVNVVGTPRETTGERLHANNLPAAQTGETISENNVGINRN
jgi:hypothetical protein